MFVREEDQIQFKTIDPNDEKDEHQNLLWIIHPKVLNISDQDNQRPLLLIEPEGSDLKSHLS